MNKTKQMSIILIISVFIAICYGLITTFLIPHAESNLVNLNSYYSAENGEKLNKQYNEEDTIYSTVTVDFLNIDEKYSEIAIIDKQINGIQIMLKKVVNSNGIDITDKVGTTTETIDNVTYNKFYINSSDLDNSDFYQKSYKFIFEEYVSDTNVLQQYLSENGDYILTHNYKLMLNNNTLINTNSIETCINLDNTETPTITTNETADKDSYIVGDTVHYTLTIEQSTKDLEVDYMNFLFSSFGIYDKNSIYVKDSKNNEVPIKINETDNHNLDIVFDTILKYGDIWTMNFDVQIPNDIFKNEDFKGYLSNNLKLVGYTQTDEDSFKVKVEGGNVSDNPVMACNIKISSDKEEYKLNETGIYTVNVDTIAMTKENEYSLNVDFDKNINTEKYIIKDILLEDKSLDKSKYIIDKSDTGFKVIFNNLITESKSINLKIVYSVLFDDESLTNHDFISTATFKINDKSEYETSIISKIIDNKKEEIDKPSFIQNQNYEMLITTDKDKYFKTDTAKYHVSITNKNDIELKNLNLIVSASKNYDVSNIKLNGETVKPNITKNDDSFSLLFQIENFVFKKNMVLEFDYTIPLVNINESEFTTKVEIFADNLNKYTFVKTIEIIEDKNIDQSTDKPIINDNKVTDNNSTNNNTNTNTNTNNNNNNNSSNNDSNSNTNIKNTTQTGDNNLIFIILLCGILISCSIYLIKKRY